MRNALRLALAAAPLLVLACRGSLPRAEGPAGPLRLWALAVTDIQPASVRISWTTHRPAASEVLYGLEGVPMDRRARSGRRTKAHVLTLDGLKTGGKYRFKVASVDARGCRVESDEGGFVPRAIPARGQVKFDGVTLLGACCGLPQVAAAAGMHADRFDSSWDALMPRPREWDARRLDAFVAKIKAFRRAGIETVITLDYCVKWARLLTDTQASWRHPAFGPPDHLADWRLFCRGLMERLKDQPQWYEVWNEPDAGYLAAPLGPGGTQRWAPPGWQPVVDPLFQNNPRYWLQDRYAPMVLAAREAADEAGGDIRLMAPAWNHDYHGGRAGLLFGVGVHKAIDAYSFHCYVAKPLSFEAWRRGFETYLENIDRTFRAHNVELPLALTEFGYENFSLPEGDESLVSPWDRAAQIAKSTLLALSRHRFTMLVAFNLAGGSMALVEEPSLPLRPRPMYFAYKHLVDRFSRRKCERYDGLAVRADGGASDPTLWHHAFRFAETGQVFVAAWQGSLDEATKRPKALPARPATFRVGPPAGGGSWTLWRVELNGSEARAEAEARADGGLEWQVELPETSPERETPPTYFLLKPTAN